jgi:hypothetical protein
MPLLNYRVSIFFCKRLCFRQFFDLQALRLTKLNLVLDVEYRFTSTIPNMNMNRPVIVAVKQELITILSEDSRIIKAARQSPDSHK